MIVWGRPAALLLLSVGIGLLPVAACAHKVSTAYLTLTGDQDDPRLFHGVWDIALLDLDFALDIDRNGDGTVTWGELRAKHAAIADYALSHLAIRADGHACRLRRQHQQVDSHSDGTYTVLDFDADCDTGTLRTLSVDYRLFYGIDPSHRGIITLRDGDETASAVSAPGDPDIDSPSIHIALPQRASRANLSGFLRANRGWLVPAFGLLLLTVTLAGAAIARRIWGRTIKPR